MKKVKLPIRDVYDLAAVTATTIKEQSEKLDFKEVINLQKAVNAMVAVTKSFSEKYDAIAAERKILVDLANNKISEFKSKLHSSAEKSGEVENNYKEKLENFVNMVLEEVQAQINKDIQPKVEDLYANDGVIDSEFELSDDQKDALLSNFEKYAKEKYTNKGRMVEVYEALI